MKNMVRNESGLEDLFRVISNYKWLIVSTVFISILLSGIYLFFTPKVYSVYSIIEVNTRDQGKGQISDDLLQNAFYTTNKEIDKEIEILKTYEVNQKVIDTISFKTQFFIDSGYKKVELYGKNIPLSVENIKTFDKDVLGVILKVSPKENGFTLEPVYSQKEVIFSKLRNDRKLIVLDEDKVHAYDTGIKNDFFELSIKKVKDFEGDIYIKINGENRNVYEHIINENLDIKQLNKNAPLIKISYQDTIPLRATMYVNSLVDTFLQEGELSKNKRTDKILKFINTQLENTKVKLDSSEKELEKFKVKNNIINVDAQSTTTINKLSDIEIEISENLFRKDLVDRVLQSIQNGAKIDAIGVVLTKLEDNGINSQLTSLQQLELDEMSLSSEYTDEYPKLIKVRHQIDSMKNSIQMHVRNLRSSIQQKIVNLKRLKSEYEQKLLNLPKKEIELVNLTSEYEVSSKMYAYLLEKKSENEMIKVATTSDYKVIEKAYLPKQPVEPKPPLVMLISLILGLMVGIVLAILLSKYGKRVKFVSDIIQNTQLPVYGVLPFSKRSAKNGIEVFDNPKSKTTENYRKLRTELNFLGKSNDSNVILITSVLGKEGKNTVISNLGAIFQLVGSKVAVVDLDLREPSLHKYFEIDYNEGVSNYLNGTSNLGDIVFPTKIPNLDLIPAGPIVKNPFELILSDKVESMFSELRKTYDYVFVNAIPVDPFTDTFRLMSYSDLNLIVLKKHYSKKTAISRLEKMIEKYQLKNVGFVIHVNDKESEDLELI